MMKFLAYLPAALLLCASCTSHSSVEQSYTILPSTDFQLSPQPLLLINNALEKDGKELAPLYSSKSKDVRHVKVEHGAQVTKLAVNSLASTMLSTNFFQDLLVYGEGENNPDKVSYHLSSADLDILKESSNCDKILSLDSLDYRFMFLEEEIKDFPLVMAKMKVIVEPFFSLHDVNYPDHALHFSKPDTFQWASTGEDLQSAINSLPELENCVADACHWAMQENLKEWIPMKYSLDRLYVHLPVATFREAKYLNATGRKEEALYMWQHAYNTSSKEDQRFVAACNISLHYEEAGDLYSAAEWLEKALKLDPTNHRIERYDYKTHLVRLKKAANSR